MKIVVLDGYTENPGDLSWDGLKQFGDLTVYDRTGAEDIAERIGDAKIVFTNKTPLTQETMQRCENMKFIGVLATGYNVVDIEAASRMGITVCNVPSYGTDTVAQYTMALLLELCHHIGEHDRSVKEGEWSRCRDFCYWKHPMMELSGKTMGIIGYGRIGQKTARLAAAFGMKVLALSGHPIPRERLGEGVRQAGLEELLAGSDVVSLHCPLTEKNKGLIRSETIAMMKDGAYFINTARGALVEEEDLAAALHSRKLGGAALDVAGIEPIRPDNPLLDAPNVIITPHIAWASREARERLMKIAVDNLRAYLEGAPQNVVSK